MGDFFVLYRLRAAFDSFAETTRLVFTMNVCKLRAAFDSFAETTYICSSMFLFRT